jgi:hypothetical protein
MIPEIHPPGVELGYLLGRKGLETAEAKEQSDPEIFHHNTIAFEGEFGLEDISSDGKGQPSIA